MGARAEEISDEQLRIAVAASRSWRGVLRTLGRTSPRTGRELKARCDVLGVDYGHFGPGGRSDDVIREAVSSALSWTDALAAAGYAVDSGSARASIRRRCAQLGISVAHLTSTHPSVREERASLRHLSAAAPLLVAGMLTLRGDRVMWPLEPAPYDLVIMRDAEPQRVQVKSTTLWRHGAWQCQLTHSTYDQSTGKQVRVVYTDDEVDLFAVVDGDLGVYLLPHDVVAGLVVISLRRYEAFRLEKPGDAADSGVR